MRLLAADRQVDLERGAAAVAILDPDAAVVQRDDGAADREPEADAARLARAVAAVELREDAFVFARRDRTCGGPSACAR